MWPAHTAQSPQQRAVLVVYALRARAPPAPDSVRGAAWRGPGRSWPHHRPCSAAAGFQRAPARARAHATPARPDTRLAVTAPTPPGERRMLAPLLALSRQTPLST